MNKPPKQYLVDDQSFLDKPGRLNISNIKMNKHPLAGRLTEIGEQILLIGSQKAKFICTGNWEFKGYSRKNDKKDLYKPSFEKVTKFDPFTY